MKTGATEEKGYVKAAQENWAGHWDSLWQEREKNPGALQSNYRKPFLKRAGSFRMSQGTIENTLGDVQDRQVLEAGCGTGCIAVMLAEKGAKVYVLDSSESALRLAKQLAEVRGVEITALAGSVLALPFRDGVFDGVFNIGVIDHFEQERRILARDEMIRVTADGGKAAIAVNDARSIIHPLAMRHAIKSGKWPFGFKAAIRNWDDMFGDESRLQVREYSRGFISQFEFLRYFLPAKPGALRIFYGIFFLVTWPLAVLNKFAGYLRVFEIKKAGDE